MKITETFVPLSHNDRQSERIARRLGFAFHITLDGNIIEHQGWKGECRRATDPELAMWARLAPPEWSPKEHGYTGEFVQAARAQMDEIERALVAPGPITMSPLDFATLRKQGRDHMDFCTDESLLRRGFRGVWEETTPVWASMSIPVGYYWRGVYETPELPPLVMGEIQSIPDVDPSIEATISVELLPFQV